LGGAHAQRRAQWAGHCPHLVGLARVLCLAGPRGAGAQQSGAGRALSQSSQALAESAGRGRRSAVRSDDNAWLEARDSAIVELLYGSGLRVGELVGLDVVAGKEARGWVDMQAAEAHVLGKGSKRRSVPVGATALQALQRWLEVRGPSGTASAAPVHASGDDAARALFTGRNGTRLTAQSVWQRLKRRSQLAGLSVPVHPHMLRHSFASHVLQSSGDLRGVQELLGHANISTTQVYTRLDFQHLAKAYDAAHPRAKLKRQP